MSNGYNRELDKWKDKARDTERQLDDLIPEVISCRKKIPELENELKKLQDEKETIKQELLNNKKKLQELQEDKEITKGQKMLLLQFAGTLDTIDNLHILQGNKIKIIAKLVGANEKNIEKDFNGRGFRLDSQLSKPPNYTFMKKLCTEYDINEWAEQVDSMLDKLKNR